MGGVIGIVFGIAIAYVGAMMFEIPFIFNQNIIFIAFFFFTVVGVIFGYFPAKKAAKLDPIEALRHEYIIKEVCCNDLFILLYCLLFATIIKSVL